LNIDIIKEIYEKALQEVPEQIDLTNFFDMKNAPEEEKIDVPSLKDILDSIDLINQNDGEQLFKVFCV
jgi:predicted CoA-binding protein